MILAEDCSPTSMTYVGQEWMLDIPANIDKRRMRSAFMIKNENKPLEEEELKNFQSSVRKIRTPQLEESETVLIDSQMRSLKITKSALNTLVKSRLSCRTCRDDYFDGSFLSKMLCTECRRFRKRADMSTCAQVCAMMTEEPPKGGEMKEHDNSTIDPDNKPDDNEFIQTCQTISMAAIHKPTMAEKILATHIESAEVPQIKATISWPISAEFLVKRPLKLSLRTLFLVMLACKKFLKKRNMKMKLEAVANPLTKSMMDPANLDSLLPLLHHQGDVTSQTHTEIGPKYHRIKSKLFSPKLKIKNITPPQKKHLAKPISQHSNPIRKI